MAAKNYKLVIMGASGVGKTVFLGSFFYATIQRGMNKKHIVSLQKDAIKPAQDLTGKLFKGAQGGTDKRVNMSFNVDDTMAVELSDLPGGYTTDVDQWIAQGIEDDLKSADGVIFFISADDLLHDYYKCVKDVVPFTAAISQYIRMTKSDSPDERADVPIYFLFTKGDLIKNDKDKKGKPHTAQKLLSMVPGLDKATKVGEKSIFFRKGKRDRAYLTCALGDWLDANTPPSQEDYKPVNVIEPMEDLFDAMQGARSTHARTKMSLKTALITGCAIAAVVVATGLNWGVQHHRWSKAEKSVVIATAEKNYPVAIRAYEEYRRTPPLLPMPRFLLPGSNVNQLIDDLYVKYEEDSYRKLSPHLTIADQDAIPDANNTSYQVVAAEIEAYLKNENFMLNAQEHYQEVKKAEPYYTTVSLMAREIKTYDDIQNILEKLDIIPRNMRPAVLNRVSSGIGLWGQLVVQDASQETDSAAIELFTTVTAQARAILDNRWIADDVMRTQIEGQIAGWNDLAEKRWDRLVGTRITNAADLEAEDAVKSLENIKLDLVGMPESCRKKLDEAIAHQYGVIVQNWKNDELTSEEVKEELANFPGMTLEAKNAANAYIRQLDGYQLEDFRTQLCEAGDLNNLNFIWKEATRELTGSSFTSDDLKGTLQEQILRVVKERLNEEKSTIDDQLTGDGDYVPKGLDLLTEVEEEMKKDMAAFTDCDMTAASNALMEWKAELLPKAEKAEYEYLKKEFHKIKSPDLIKSFIDPMKAFINKYPRSQNNAEVQQAIDYLEKVSNGYPATITISQVSNIKDRRMFTSPKLYVVVCDTNSQTVDERRVPVVKKGNSVALDDRVNFTWQINNVPIIFAVFDTDDDKNYLGAIRLNCNGVTGWKAFNNDYSLIDPDGNSNGRIYLSVKGLPDCPW